MTATLSTRISRALKVCVNKQLETIKVESILLDVVVNVVVNVVVVVIDGRL